MDSLCKTAKLACSVLRLRQTSQAVDLSHAIKYRRDVCFSQALTSLVTAVMTRLWCTPQDQAHENAMFLAICVHLGPLAYFESLLSLHGDETTMFNDMIVVIEDLRNVEFTLILVDKRSKFRLRNNSSSKNNSQKSSPSVPILEYHSFPLPRITGSRSSLKVSSNM
jgi:inositol polyphosphate-4-phosphatase